MSDPTVLLVEDNADDIELARRAFEKAGMADKVRVSMDGAEALDYLLGAGVFSGQGTPAAVKLILLDLNLPKMSGLVVLRRLRLNPSTQHLPVVVLTVSRREPDLLQSFTMGISDYLIKPLDADRFRQIYRKYVKTDPA
jgi:two-component system response regulator